MGILDTVKITARCISTYKENRHDKRSVNEKPRSTNKKPFKLSDVMGLRLVSKLNKHWSGVLESILKHSK